jgi:2-methylcitrate dehydratase PrpD
MAVAEALPAAAALARFVVGTRFDEIPATVRHEAKRSLLNFVGCALGVPQDPAVAAAVRVLMPFCGGGDAVVYGRRERMDVMGASFVNAVAGNLLDYDDTHLPTVIHPSAAVAPPVLAVAASRGLSGAEVLAAFALGAEVECRLGNSVMPGHYARGWHITATCGVMGAAAAVSRLLGLDEERTASAIGIAASQSAGLVENLSTAAKNVGVGNAARNGVFAALMAEQGYAAAPTCIEGPLGWARACGDEPVMSQIVGGLGSRYAFARNTYKPYPAGIVMHAVIDACLELRTAHELEPARIARVTVSGDALLLARGDRVVRDQRDARVSIHHAAACALLWGRAGVPEFSEACVGSAEAVAFRDKVEARLDDTLPTGAARVQVQTTDGERHECVVEHARGSIEAPLSDADIEYKVRALADMGGSGCDVDGLVRHAWSLDRAGDVVPFLSCTLPS